MYPRWTSVRTSRWIDGSGNPERLASSLRPTSPPASATISRRSSTRPTDCTPPLLAASAIGPPYVELSPGGSSIPISTTRGRSAPPGRRAACPTSDTAVGTGAANVPFVGMWSTPVPVYAVDGRRQAPYSLRQAEDNFHDAKEAPMRFEVNLTILFTELPLLERPAAAKQAGFDAVEFWWPWPVAVPSDAEVDAFVGAVTDAGVQLVGLNFFAGDMPGGDRG